MRKQGNGRLPHLHVCRVHPVADRRQVDHMVRQLPVLALAQQLLAAEVKHAQHGADASEQAALEGRQRAHDALHLRLVQQLKARAVVQDAVKAGCTCLSGEREFQIVSLSRMLQGKGVC